jgi:hypothetical protein
MVLARPLIAALVSLGLAAKVLLRSLLINKVSRTHCWMAGTSSVLGLTVRATSEST